MPPPLPILLNAIFIEIIPRDKEFAMMIPRSHSAGNVVAWLGESVVGVSVLGTDVAGKLKRDPAT
jgi:hypothetical protein